MMTPKVVSSNGVISAPKKRTSINAVKHMAAVLMNVRVIAPNLLRMIEIDNPYIA